MSVNLAWRPMTPWLLALKLKIKFIKIRNGRNVVFILSLMQAIAVCEETDGYQVVSSPVNGYNGNPLAKCPPGTQVIRCWLRNRWVLDDTRIYVWHKIRESHNLRKPFFFSILLEAIITIGLSLYSYIFIFGSLGHPDDLSSIRQQKEYILNAFY